MKKHIAVVSMLILTMAGCKPLNRVVVESSSIQTYKIVDIRSPKHFRVVLEDANGKRTGIINVSKHCNRWREVKLGSIVQLPVDVMRYESDTGERWINIQARSICPGN